MWTHGYWSILRKYVWPELTMLHFLQQMVQIYFKNMDWLSCTHFHNMGLKASDMLFEEKRSWVYHIYLCCWLFFRTDSLEYSGAFSCKDVKPFHQECFCTIKSLFIYFQTIFIKLININMLYLILWDINMHWRVWIIIWIEASFRNILITFIIWRVLTSINGYSIR